MINLFIQYYKDKSPDRQNELDNCLLNNIQCAAIDKIYVISESEIDSQILSNDKIVELIHEARPTYNIFFEAIRMYSKDDDWNIIANTDIYFDETILKVNEYKSLSPICFALTRWEVEKDRTTFLNRVDSQDSWIVKGKPNHVNGGFCLGVAGCDNAIANRLYVAGYNVINPSKTIKTYHLHTSGVRNYNVNRPVPQPYKLLTPTI